LLTFDSFDLVIPAKWVLTGEHAVLRGYSAIAFPHPEYCLELKYESEKSDHFEVFPADAGQLVFGLLDNLFESVGVPADQRPKGRLTLKMQIPLGAGLGSSASLCVGLVKGFLKNKNLSIEEVIKLACKMEDHFHGRSSGMDVTVVAVDKPILYKKALNQFHYEVLDIKNFPGFKFHDSGLRANTRTCVKKVEALFLTNPELAQALDAQMGKATECALQALRDYTHNENADELLIEAMQMAQNCFERWELVPRESAEMLSRLKSQGARAIKLTGAGGGGYFVTLT